MVGSVCRRWVTVLVALVVVLAGAVTASTAAVASGTGDAHSQYGYPYPNAPDCNESSGANCVADKWNYYQGQCTSWVAYRLNTVNGVSFTNRYGGVAWSNASNWKNAANQLQIPVNGTPARGAIAWYSFGHVGYVESVNSDGSVVMSEMNHDYHNGFRFITIRPGNYWPTGFIHIKDLTTPQPPQPPADRDGDGVPDVNDACPDVYGHASNRGCPRTLVPESQLRVNSPGGLFKGARARLSFSVRNTTGSPVKVGYLIVAARDSEGKNRDRLCAKDFTLAAGATRSCAVDYTWDKTGTHSFFADWTDAATGTWHAGQLGVTQTFQIQNAPVLLSADGVTVSNPGGLFKGARARLSFSVRNTTGSPVRVGLLIVAARDSEGKNRDRLCAKDFTLAAGATRSCAVDYTWDKTGTHSFYADWTDAATGTWHAGQLGVTQTFQIQNAPVLLAADGVTVSNPGGLFTGARARLSFSVRNTTGSPVKVGYLIVAARDSEGKNRDRLCAKDFTLAAGATRSCAVDYTWDKTGTHSFYADWTDAATGTWHAGQLGEGQVFNVRAPSAPQRPGNVTLTKQDAAILVKWSQPKIAPGASPVTNYSVWRREWPKVGPAGAWQTTTVTGSVREFRVSNLTPGTRQEVSVRAVSYGTLSAFSPVVTATVAARPGASKKVTVKRKSGKKVRIGWRAASTNGSPITRYAVQVKRSRSKWKTVRSVTGSDAKAKKFAVAVRVKKTRVKLSIRVVATNAYGSKPSAVKRTK